MAKYRKILRSDLKGVKLETKPAFYTTEFWVTMFGNLGGLLNLLGAWNFVPNQWVVIALAVINGLYAVSRGQAKSSVPYTGPRKGPGQ